mmetsp:Transcript_27020/g.83677  ORF Transcript_27020/g.83677 Transcript_27020/m.83677 type:complete len:239 (-) Transcript_27020:138-854(-)
MKPANATALSMPPAPTAATCAALARKSNDPRASSASRAASGASSSFAAEFPSALPRPPRRTRRTEESRASEPVTTSTAMSSAMRPLSGAKVGKVSRASSTRGRQKWRAATVRAAWNDMNEPLNAPRRAASPTAGTRMHTRAHSNISSRACHRDASDTSMAIASDGSIVVSATADATSATASPMATRHALACPRDAERSDARTETHCAVWAAACSALAQETMVEAMLPTKPAKSSVRNG